MVVGGAIFIALAIILGAFGAHALKEVLTAESLRSFEVGARYTFSDEIDGSVPDAGELSRYRMGVGYLNTGKFQEAINALEGVEFSDILVGAVAKGALGDAYFEIGQVDDAISNYKAAISHSDNDFTTPIYLKKMAIAYEKAGEAADLKSALEAYQTIKDKYPTSAEARGVDKFIAKLQAK